MDADVNALAWVLRAGGISSEEEPEMATVTVHHTVTTDVVVELDTTTMRMSTTTRTMTRTVTVFTDEGLARVDATGAGVFNAP